MTLIKTSLLSSIAVIIKMLTLLGINKILAVYVGPSGYAALGQFQNAVQMISTFASGAINTGVTKYTAEYSEDVNKQQAVWRTAGTIVLIGSAVSGLLVALYNRRLAVLFLGDESLGSVFLWFSLALILFVLNNLILAILNGRKEINLYVAANIAGSVFALAVTGVMAVKLGLYGALVALAIYQSLAFFTTLALAYKASWFQLRYLFGGVDKVIARNLFKFTAMALTSAACVPVSHILIRNYLGESLGWDSAGYWEAMWRLSTAYLMFVTTTLGVYYLPKLSELKVSSAIRREIIQGYKVILPVAAFCGLTIYLFRDFLVQVLFSSEFLPMRDLFGWQLLGDSLKIASWILGYIITAKALVKLYVLSEVFFCFLFYLLVVLLVPVFGLEGVAVAHALNYFFYFLFVFVCMKRLGVL